VRPLAIAAVAVVLGAVLLVLWRSAGLSLVVGVLGALLMVLGLALAAAALVLTARLRTEVRLEPDALTVVRRGRSRSLPWDQVREVTLDHPRLTVSAAEPDAGLVVVNPRRPDDPRFASLLSQIRQRLDAGHG
jgi:O-antigen ligase